LAVTSGCVTCRIRCGRAGSGDGGAGFIGSHVAYRLAAQGHEPVVLDALIPQAHGSEKLPVGDSSTPTSAITTRCATLRGVDAVCHQAAMVGHGVEAADAAYNDLGTAVLLAAMYEVCPIPELGHGA
jgi:dTDP-L-rhamnose 4-epimerase